MKDKKETKAQTNLQFPYAWKVHLEKLARELSFKQDKDINYQDLIREAVRKQYNLNEDD